MPKKEIGFIPARGSYLILVQDAPPTSKGGLYLPDQAKERPMEGVIVAVGPSKGRTASGPIKPDYFLKDIVLFGKYSGTEVNIDDTNYLIVEESDILGKRV